MSDDSGLSPSMSRRRTRNSLSGEHGRVASHSKVERERIVSGLVHSVYSPRARLSPTFLAWYLQGQEERDERITVGVSLGLGGCSLGGRVGLGVRKTDLGKVVLTLVEKDWMNAALIR